MIKFTYMNSTIATFGTLYDDIWRGLPIASNLRLPQEQYYKGQVTLPQAGWYLMDSQQKMRDANYLIKHTRRRLMDSINEKKRSPDTIKIGETFELTPLTKKEEDLIDRIHSLSYERNKAKNRITEIARRYSNTPFNIRFRNLP